MKDAMLVVCMVLALLGAIFCLLASLGVIRMRDTYMRMQTASKGSTLGACCILLAAAVYFGEAGMAVRCLLVVLFLFLTVPVAAHMLGRAAHLARVPKSPRTHIDQLEGKYDPVTHRLAPFKADPPDQALSPAQPARPAPTGPESDAD